MELVLASLDDLEKVVELVQAYFSHDNLNFTPEVSAAIAELLGNPSLGAYFLICSESAISGCIGLTYGFDSEVGGRMGIVIDFYLEEAARGKGLGKAALQQLTEFAKSQGLLQLDLVVINGNLRAEHLYSTQGFKRTSGRFSMSKKIIEEARLN